MLNWCCVLSHQKQVSEKLKKVYLLAIAMGLFTYYCVQGITKIKMQLAIHFQNCIRTQF